LTGFLGSAVAVAERTVSEEHPHPTRQRTLLGELVAAGADLGELVVVDTSVSADHALYLPTSIAR
jgi:hypothetical protein